MGQAILLMLLAATAIASLARPWIGVIAAYLFVVLGPQSIWWWAFQGIRPVLWVTLPTIVGLIIAVARGQIDFGTFRSKRLLFFFVLWLSYILSYLAGPYVNVDGIYRFTDPDWAMSTINKIMLLFFIACLCIDDMRKLKALVAVMIFSGSYMIYWANHQYLSGQVVGRMVGPASLGGGGNYADNNNFAMLLVVVLPFFWYCGFALKSRLLQGGLWLIIPFGWHAIFLTGSRGGLVGIAATMALMIWRSKNKGFAILIVPAFIGAYFWQAGDVMKDRAATISEYKTERSASGRLDAWSTATKMIADHPITGVGLASFGPAYPDYSDTQVREAHNTFFQIAGESGIIAGGMYLFILLTSFLVVWQIGKKLRNSRESDDDETLYLINEAVLVGYSGLVVCSMFLSLQMFEIFFCLNVMINAIWFVQLKTRQKSVAESPITEDRAESCTARVTTQRL